MFRDVVGQISPVLVIHHVRRQLQQLIQVDIAQLVGNFFYAGDFQPLAFLDGLYVICSLHERLVGPGIEPAEPSAEGLYRKLAAPQVFIVDVGYFQFASRGRSNTPGDGDHIVVVKIEPGDCVARLRLRRLFLNPDHLIVPIELHHP